MARHDQKPYTTKQPFVCEECKFGACDNCIDVARAILPRFVPLCSCKRSGHDGEPVSSQVRDPFDGSVHGPGAVITKDSEVKFNDKFREQFKRQFDGLGE